MAGKGVSEQSAAIPYRKDDVGTLQVLLITSRRTRRWIIPKGKVKPGMMAHISAAREAFEEAGVMGRVAPRPVGTYLQTKTASSGSSEHISVRAFALEVGDELPVWPEMHDRDRRWFNMTEAVQAITDEEIRSLLRTFEYELGT